MTKAKKEYITKRLVERQSKKAFTTASTEAMEANGYVIIVKDGYVVKESSDGSIEILEELDNDISEMKLVLD